MPLHGLDPLPAPAGTCSLSFIPESVSADKRAARQVPLLLFRVVLLDALEGCLMRAQCLDSLNARARC